MRRSFYSILAITLALGAGSLLADAPSPAEAKAREQLRAALLQLRTSENEKAALQATQTENEDKIKELTEKADALTKKLAEDKIAAEKTKAELETEVAKRDTEMAKVKEALAAKVDDDNKKTALAQSEKVEIGKLQEQINLLNRRVAEQQTKNAAMFKIGNEILQRYEKFGLGDALSAREPFTGITRVKLQSLFEDYQDKLVDQRIKPETSSNAASAAPSSSTAAPAKSKSAPAPKTTDPKPRS